MDQHIIEVNTIPKDISTSTRRFDHAMYRRKSAWLRFQAKCKNSSSRTRDGLVHVAREHLREERALTRRGSSLSFHDVFPPAASTYEQQESPSSDDHLNQEAIPATAVSKFFDSLKDEEMPVEDQLRSDFQFDYPYDLETDDMNASIDSSADSEKSLLLL